MTQQRKVLHVIYSMDPKLGGTVEALLQIIRASQNSARNQLHEILTVDAQETIESLDHEIPIHAVGPAKRFYGDTPKLDAWLDDYLNQYDLAIIHGCWQYHGLATFRACQKQNIPYFQYTHGMLDPWFKKQYPFKHLKKWLYWPWAEYRILKHATRVIFTCEEEQRLAAKSFWLYKATPAIVSLGIQPPTSSLEQCKDQFFKQQPELLHERFLTFMSRIHEKKGVDLLLNAAIQFQKKAKNIRPFTLVIAGPCSNSEYLKSLKSFSASLPSEGPIKKIVWLDMVRGDSKWGLLAASEAFILPSHQENFGMVVAESLYCRTPVLISDKVNIWREVLQGNAGIVETDTIEGTLKLLKKWTGLDDSKKLDYRSAASACYQSKFRIETNAEGLFQLIDAHSKPSHL